jgi:ATP-binding cassette subfamily B protein
MILRHLVFTTVPVAVELFTVLLVLMHLVAARFLLLFSGAVICYVVAFAHAARTVTKVARNASSAGIDATARMTDGLLNYETVKCCTAEALVQERVARALGRSECEWVMFYRRYTRNGLVVATIFGCFLLATVFYATREVHQGRMSIGAFVLVSTYMLQVVRPLEMLGYAMQGISQGVAMLEKLLQLLGEPTEQALVPKSRFTSGRGTLEFQNVSLSYGTGRPVLRGVSFSVTAGRTLGIVGPSGSGKSTIVRLLMRLLEPEGGRILLDGIPIFDMALHELRRAISVVPQDTVLFDDTIGFNIALGRAGASDREIDEAARVAQLRDFVMTLPDGYDTVVGERGVKLSGGERQRISIARAVLKSPSIYVFDEATSSLDSGTEQEIVCSLRAISRANTTLVIAHRLSTVAYADQIIVVQNGRIDERGTHVSLLRHDGKYASLWKAQQGGAAAA